jgi:hypothetical protein
MTRSSPSDCSFCFLASDPATATTRAPASCASCTAKCPVPPAAAVTSTTSPGCTLAVCSSAAAAVTADRVNATASGVAASRGVHMAACVTPYSENAAAPLQATAWPTDRPVTPGPTAATTPAPSAPRLYSSFALLAVKAPSPRTRKVSQPPLIPAYSMRTSTCAQGWAKAGICGPRKQATARVCGVSSLSAAKARVGRLLVGAGA